MLHLTDNETYNTLELREPDARRNKPKKATNKNGEGRQSRDPCCSFDSSVHARAQMDLRQPTLRLKSQGVTGQSMIVYHDP